MSKNSLIAIGLAPLAFLVTAGAAQAQDAEATPAVAAVAVEAPAEAPAGPIVVTSPVETKCELHVFPAERFQSMTTGWLGGGLIDAAIHADKDKSNRTQLASALDPAGQIDALRSMDLIGLLKIEPANIVFHPTALERKPSARSRRAAPSRSRPAIPNSSCSTSSIRRRQSMAARSAR